MDILNNILNKIYLYIANKGVGWQNKFFVIIAIALIAVVLNDVFGFAFYYNARQKIDYVQKAHQWLSDRRDGRSEDILDDHSFQMLIGLTKSVVERESSLLQNLINDRASSTGFVGSPTNIEYSASNVLFIVSQVDTVVYIKTQNTNLDSAYISPITQKHDTIIINKKLINSNKVFNYVSIWWIVAVAVYVSAWGIMKGQREGYSITLIGVFVLAFAVLFLVSLLWVAYCRHYVARPLFTVEWMNHVFIAIAPIVVFAVLYIFIRIKHRLKSQ